MAATGSGTTISNTQDASAFVGRVMKIGAFQMSVPTLDDTGLDTEDYAELCFGDVATLEPITVDVLQEGGEALPKVGIPQNWQIVFKSGKILAGTAAIIQGSTPEQETNVRTRHTFQLQFDGKTGPTLT